MLRELIGKMMLQGGIFVIILLALRASSTPVGQSFMLSARDDLSFNRYVAEIMVTALKRSRPHKLAR